MSATCGGATAGQARKEKKGQGRTAASRLRNTHLLGESDRSAGRIQRLRWPAVLAERRLYAGARSSAVRRLKAASCEGDGATWGRAERGGQSPDRDESKDDWRAGGPQAGRRAPAYDGERPRDADEGE